MGLAVTSTVEAKLLARRRRGLQTAFFLIGLVFASWVSRLAAVRQTLRLDNAQMGLVLLGLASGAMIGIISAGRAVPRLGTRRVIHLGMSCIISGAAIIAGGTALADTMTVTIGLAVMGLGVGGSEIAANIDGADVERAAGRAFLPRLHGFFSVGALTGAVIGIAAESVYTSVPAHLALVTVFAAALLVSSWGTFAHGVGRRWPRSRLGASARKSWAVDRTLLLIAAVVLAMAFAEGAANDWLPLVMVDGHGVSHAASTVFYAGFVAATAVGRFGGNSLVDKFGKLPLLQASGVTAAVGVAVVIFADTAWLAGIGAIVWGLGVSLGFPVALSAAGDSGPDSTAKVSFASTVGYVAFLVGPPSLGFVGEHVGLRQALVAVLIIAVLATVAARAAATVAARGTVSDGAFPAGTDHRPPT